MNNILENFNDDEINKALYGLFLGDGCYHRSRIVIKHTDKQKFYNEWLEKIFVDYGLVVHSRYDFVLNTNLGSKVYNEIAIKPPNYTFRNGICTCFDENGKKVISQYILDNINILGLLFWYLDDGQLHVSIKNNKGRRFAYLNTQSFSYEENLMIQKMFKERFNIDTRLHKDCSGFEKYKNSIYYRIYFNATNFRKFYDILRPYLSYIPKEFYYKFNMQYYPNRIKQNEEFSKKYNLS